MTAVLVVAGVDLERIFEGLIDTGDNVFRFFFFRVLDIKFPFIIETSLPR